MIEQLRRLFSTATLRESVTYQTLEKMLSYIFNREAVFKGKVDFTGADVTGIGSSSWDDIKDKPTSFPPSSHTHPEKQDTLVSGVNIKTINTNSLLGSGDITISGGVTSVNTQTGVVVLDADDISDSATTNKFVTASDLTNLGNLSGVNSGDQDLSGYAEIVNLGGVAFSNDYDDLDNKPTLFTLPALTAGSVLFSNGTTISQDNSNLFWDDSNNYLAIGTSSPSSKIDITTNSLGTTQTTTSGLALVNNTAAAAGAQQISPAIRWSGKGWKTNATAASQDVSFRVFVVPVQSTVNPTGYLQFESSINGATYGRPIRLFSTGAIDTDPVGNGSGGGVTASFGSGFALSGAVASWVRTSSGTTKGTAGVALASATNVNRGLSIRPTGNLTFTSGEISIMECWGTFAPTSGTATFEASYIQPTINQTGGANGITRGLYINPTLTSAAGWRSIEITNNTGYGVYQTGTAPNYLAGVTLTKVLVEANTAGSGSPNTITAAESRSVFTNEGATALNYHTLPTAAAGLVYTFYVQDTDGIRVVANTGDTIRIDTVVSAAAGYAESTTVGSSVTLTAINATEWVATSVIGTWTLT